MENTGKDSQFSYKNLKNQKYFQKKVDFIKKVCYYNDVNKK